MTIDRNLQKSSAITVSFDKFKNIIKNKKLQYNHYVFYIHMFFAINNKIYMQTGQKDGYLFRGIILRTDCPKCQQLEWNISI